MLPHHVLLAETTTAAEYCLPNHHTKICMAIPTRNRADELELADVAATGLRQAQPQTPKTSTL